jgi:DNA-binding LacI/PurR family transcriptional regulator
MRDVAEAAGVSVSTVANVVCGRVARMDPALRARVEAEIARLGYRPNHMARSFKTGRTPLLGLLVPSMSNPSYGAWARAIESAAEPLGFRLLIGNSYRDPARERAFLQDLMSHGLRGALIVSPHLEAGFYPALIDQGLRVTSLDRRPGPEPQAGVDAIYADMVGAMALAVGHLKGLGHAKLAYVGPEFPTVSRGDKIAAFSACGGEVLLGPVAGESEDAGLVALGSSLAPEVLRRGVTAVVAMNDLVALGLIGGLGRLGAQVPGDVSVLGFDDLAVGGAIPGGLTSVAAPLLAMAQVAVRRLVGRLKGEELPQECGFATELMLRGSTGPLRE